MKKINNKAPAFTGQDAMRARIGGLEANNKELAKRIQNQKKIDTIKPAAIDPRLNQPVTMPDDQRPIISPELQKQRQDFFSARRAEAQRNVNQSGAQAQDALARRFAAIGQTGSGAQIASLERLQENQAQQLRDAGKDVDAMELQAKEGDIDRQFQADESRRGREMALRDMNQRGLFFANEQGNKLQEIALAQKQFELDRQTTDFNKGIADKMAKKKEKKFLGIF